MYFINLPLRDFFLDAEQTAKLKTQSMKMTFFNSIFTFTLSDLSPYISCESHRFHYKLPLCMLEKEYVHTYGLRIFFLTASWCLCRNEE